MPPKELDSSASALAFFGAELRYWREKAGLSQEALAGKVYCSPSLIAYIEQGMRTPSEEFAQRSDDVLGTGGVLSRMWPLVRKSGYPGYFEDVARLERLATELCCLDLVVIPGLLQTADYARAVIRAGVPDKEECRVEELVAARLERFSILEPETRPKAWFVIDESVLRRTFSGREVMRSQLQRLIDVAALPKVCVQILPLDSEASTAVDGYGLLMSFADGPDIAYVEGLAGGHAFTGPEIVERCARKFDLLRAVALSPQKSVELIRSVMEGL